MPSNLPSAPTVAELRASADELTRQIHAADPGILTARPMAAFLATFDNAGRPRPYNRISPQAADTIESLAQEHGQGIVAAYLKLALTHLLAQLIETGRLERQPPAIREQYDIHIRLTAADLACRPDAYYRLRSDLFLKDLALFSERMLPCGAQLIERISGVPRSLVKRGGAAQALRFAWFYCVRMHGFVPYYEMHTDTRRMTEFTPAGWDRFYLRIAAMLERNPTTLGLIGGSWWFDPVVPKLSPQLAFLHETPLAYGAQVFFYETEQGESSPALLRSPERQKAYDEGSYTPKAYILVWPRAGILRWARENG